MIQLGDRLGFEPKDVLVEWDGDAADPWVNITIGEPGKPIGTLSLAPSQAMELAAWLLIESGRAMELPPHVLAAMRADLKGETFLAQPAGEES